MNTTDILFFIGVTLVVYLYVAILVYAAIKNKRWYFYPEEYKYGFFPVNKMIRELFGITGLKIYTFIVAFIVFIASIFIGLDNFLQ